MSTALRTRRALENVRCDGWPAYLSFAAGNSIPYWQDFGAKRGLPAGVRFRVEACTRDRVCLRAAGYGAPGRYGNGALYVYNREIPGAVGIRVDGQDVWRWREEQEP